MDIRLTALCLFALASVYSFENIVAKRNYSCRSTFFLCHYTFVCRLPKIRIYVEWIERRKGEWTSSGSLLISGKFKQNKVGHSPREAELRKKNKSLAKHRRENAVDTSDMKKQLEEAEAEEVRVTKGGISFTLDPGEGDPSRMPSRLADRLDGALTPPDSDREVQYSSEEKEILAELLRNDILREKSVNARRDMFAYDAARRRAARNT